MAATPSKHRLVGVVILLERFEFRVREAKGRVTLRDRSLELLRNAAEVGPQLRFPQADRRLICSDAQKQPIHRRGELRASRPRHQISGLGLPPKSQARKRDLAAPTPPLHRNGWRPDRFGWRRPIR